MHLRDARFLFFCVVLWHWCNGKNIPEDLQKDNITPPIVLGEEPPTNKTMDQLIMEAMGGLKDTLNIKSKDDGILMELDMLLSKQQYYSLYEQPNSSTLIRRKRKAIRNPILRWPNGVIPYRFYPRHFSQSEQYMIRQAMTEWERNTCLRFREATSSDINSVLFINGFGCFSLLGMAGGVQKVSLSSVGCRSSGVYLHEIGHVIGLVHEQNRPDRDDYVKIIRENVQTEYLNQFTKYTLHEVDQMNVPYDYYSVMHYGVTAFSRSQGLKTIIFKHPVNEARVGNPYTQQPSFSDIAVVNKMYTCHGECKNLLSDARSCDSWAKAGHCKTNQYVIINCAKSCGTCSDRVKKEAHADDSNGGCRDEMDTCVIWAGYGLCDYDIDEAVRLCPKTCNLCDHL